MALKWISKSDSRHLRDQQHFFWNAISYFMIGKISLIICFGTFVWALVPTPTVHFSPHPSERTFWTAIQAKVLFEQPHIRNAGQISIFRWNTDLLIE